MKKYLLPKDGSFYKANLHCHSTVSDGRFTPEEIKKAGMDIYFVDHTTGLYPVAASGVPFDMKYVGVKGDVIADLNEDLAAEQKARVTYDNILRLCDDPDVRDPIKYLRQREIVHDQRFADPPASRRIIRTARNSMPSIPPLTRDFRATKK